MAEYPWEILGLDEDTVTERGIKRAYARLLRKHRPDEDPEGFQRVHDAYQQALAELKWKKEMEEMDSGDVPGLSTPGGAGADADEGGEAGDPGDSIPFEKPAPPAPTLELPPNLRPPERPLNLKAPSKRPLRLVPLDEVRAVDILDELEAGDTERASRVLRAVLAKDQRRFKVQLAEAVLADPDRFDHLEITPFLCELASAIAFGYPDMAEKILDEVFGNLPSHLSQMYTQQANQMIALGQAFKANVRRAHLGFWNAAFLDPFEVDWDSSLAEKALREVDQFGNWDGYQLLDQVVPVEKQLWNQRRRRKKTPRAARRRRAPAEEGIFAAFGAFFGWVADHWWVIWIVIMAISFIGRMNRETSSERPDLRPLTAAEIAAEAGWKEEGPNAIRPEGVIVHERVPTVVGEAVVYKGSGPAGPTFYVFLDARRKIFEEADYKEWRQKKGENLKVYQSFQERFGSSTSSESAQLMLEALKVRDYRD